jgi:hypothetical protein
MKIIHSIIRGILLAAVLSLQVAVPTVRAGEQAAETEFPFVIQVEMGAAEFGPNDNIVITSIRGDRKHIEPGGRYLVDGSYTLSSAEDADLALHITSRGPSGPSSIMADQHVKISRGSGVFHLKKTVRDTGWMHVSFYVDGHSHGGIYFGEKGFDQTTLRKKGWSDFSTEPVRSKPAVESISTKSHAALASDANLAILEYLGNPVPAPPSLNAKYNQANLRTAFATLSQKSGLAVKLLEVDDSEFPFLAYGVLAGNCDFRVLEKGLRDMNGYAYGGSVVGREEESTYFSLNMIPHGEYPSQLCDRRLMVRLQMLADKARGLVR